MKFLNSLFETFKKYWYMFVILSLTVLVISVSFIENTKIAQLVRTLKDTAGNYKKRVDTIDKLADNKTKKDKKANKTYEEIRKEIEQKREEDLAKVNARKLQIVEELKDKTAEELAKKMKEEFKL
jgi:F0F1-type ATP synthase membrane subunit b/b'